MRLIILEMAALEPLNQILTELIMDADISKQAQVALRRIQINGKQLLQRLAASLPPRSYQTHSTDPNQAPNQ